MALRFRLQFLRVLITGEQFRSQLHKLICCCHFSSSADVADDDVRVARHGQTDITVSSSYAVM